METDKENIHRIKAITKIPLPKEPLPPLPKHLVESKKTGALKEMNERYPLKTLIQTHENFALPGPSRATPSTLKLKRVDDRHVTRRHKNENLDWDLNIFKDVDGSKNVIIISDDDEDSNKKDRCKFFAANKQRNCVELSVETPVVKSLEPSRVRNLKRSLKRPHSRELQGLPPVANNQRIVEKKVRRKLQFNEPLQERLRSPDFLKKSYMVCHTRDYMLDAFEYLISSEQRPITPRISSFTRACVINWLMNINGADGNPANVQTAIWYLDSVLATGYVEVAKLQLIATACYWLASKLHGPVLSAHRLVKYADQAFTTEQLLVAEKAILERLKYPRQPIIPQEFITYFAWWCDETHPGEIEVAATFLCMSGQMVDKCLCNEFPSVIGAAAVKNALLLLSKKDLMKHLQMCPVFKSAETKATNISYTCSMLRRAVRAVASPEYEYKAPLDHYGTPPYYIAQKIINAANNLSLVDVRNTCKNN